MLQFPKRLRRFYWFPLLVILAGAGFLLNVSRASTRVEGCHAGCAHGDFPSGPSVRILSMNMLHGYPGFEDLPRRLRIIEEELSRLNPDLLLLQEVPWTPAFGNVAEHLASEIGFNYLYLRANGNRHLIHFEEGEAILSRFPLKEPVLTELKPRAGFFEHRVVLGATAVTPWGDLQLFVTHLTNGRSRDNQGQSASLKTFVQSHATGPAIVAGDFNATADLPQIKTLVGEWLDIYPEQNGLPRATCCIDDLSSPSTDRPDKRIDYFFIVTGENKPISVIEIQRVFSEPFRLDNSWLWASDHTGLLATISIVQ